MGLKQRTQRSRGTMAHRAYGLAGLGLLAVSLMFSVQMAPRSGQASQSLFVPAHVHAENAWGLRFRFVDTDTNARVNPDVLSIDGLDYTDRVANGQLELPAEAKSYVVSVMKDGYELMEEIFIEPTTGGFTEFRLLSSDWTAKSNSASDLGQNEGRVIGYVRDGATGAPLANATIALEGQTSRTTADVDGYFSLSYSVSAQDQTDPAKIHLDNLQIRAEGYVGQDRQYVALFGGAEIKYLVNLDAQDPALNGGVVEIMDERLTRGGAAAEIDVMTPNAPVVRNGTPEDLGPDDPSLQAAPVIDSINKVAGIRSHNIRVGFNCSCRTCSTVQVMNLEEYTRHSLPAEWISSWVANSLEAGAVAVRSYAGSFIVNPISSRYDICTNTCCQAYTSSTNSRTDAAIRATNGLYVVRGPVHGGSPFRAEYSSENNLAPPCRTNGKTGTCLDDQVCLGRSTNGHGRGMCQFGSQFWGSGAPRSGGPKDRIWILEHYYPNNPGYAGQNIRLGHW